MTAVRLPLLVILVAEWPLELDMRWELASFGLYVGPSRLTDSHIDSIAMKSPVIPVSRLQLADVYLL